jgi:Kef-type K+ transport system membrane component KefB
MPAETAIHFFLALAVILVACRVVGLVAQRLGQPQVVGEMIAGVLLGPSLLGRMAPGVQHDLFPREEQTSCCTPPRSSAWCSTCF